MWKHRASLWTTRKYDNQIAPSSVSWANGGFGGRDEVCGKQKHDCKRYQPITSLSADAVQSPFIEGEELALFCVWMNVNARSVCEEYAVMGSLHMACVLVWGVSYGRGGRKRDVSNRGLQLVDGSFVLVCAIVCLHGFDLDVEFSWLVLIFWVTGWIEGVLFGMWTESLRKTVHIQKKDKRGGMKICL